MAFRLAELFIDITMKGLSTVSTGLGQIKGQLEAVQVGVDKVGKFGAIAFATLSAATLGWVRAGLQGTGTGDQLAYQFERLSKSIASIFLPQIEAVIEAVGKVADWFRGLTKAQQESIGRWTLAGIAAGAVALVLPQVLSGLISVTTGVYALTSAFIGLNVVSGGILAVVGAVVTALAALAAGFEVSQHGTGRITAALGALWDGLKAVWAVIQPVAEQFLAFGQQIGEAVLPFLLALKAGFESTFAVVADAVAPILEELGPLFAEIGKLILEVVSAVGELTAGLAEDTFSVFIAGLKLVVGFIKNVVLDTIRLLTAALRQLRGLLESFGVLKPIELKAPEGAAAAGKAEPGRQIEPAGRGFESLTSGFKRVQEEAAKMFGGKSDADKTTAAVEEGNATLADIRDALQNMEPVVGA